MQIPRAFIQRFTLQLTFIRIIFSITGCAFAPDKIDGTAQIKLQQRYRQRRTGGERVFA